MCIFIYLQFAYIASNFEKLAPSNFIIITTTANTTSSVVGEALRARACFLFRCSLCAYSLVSRPRQSARAESRPHAPWRFSPPQLRPHRPLRGGAPAAGPDGKCPSRSAACAAREPGGGRFGACATHAGPSAWTRRGIERGCSAVGARSVLRKSCIRGGGGGARASGPSPQELSRRADAGANFVRLAAPGGSQAAVV